MLYAYNSNLLLWAFNTNADIMAGMTRDNSMGMTQQVQTILEECWLERNKTLKLIQINWFLEQLPVRIIWEVGEDKLWRCRHEVVLVQLVANIIWGSLRLVHTASHYTNPNSPNSRLRMECQLLMIRL